MKTSDGGQTWTGGIVQANYFGLLHSIAVNADWLVIDGGAQGSGVWRFSVNSLTSPEFVAFPGNYFGQPSEIIEKDGAFLASTSAGQLASPDGGRTWHPAGLFGRNVWALAKTSSSVVAVTGDGRVFENLNPFADTTALSAASYNAVHSPGAILAFFGSGLATSTEVAATRPLPLELGGSQIELRDLLDVPRAAGLFFVSPNQINAELPASLPQGEVRFTIRAPNGIVRSGFLNIVSSFPAIFAANADGKGVPAAFILRVSPNNQQTYLPVYQFDVTKQQFVAAPVRLAPSTDTYYLVIYGTGWRYRVSLASCAAVLNSTRYPVEYAGEAPGFVGLDQMNIRITTNGSLNGTTTLRLTVDGRVANQLTLQLTR